MAVSASMRCSVRIHHALRRLLGFSCLLAACGPSPQVRYQQLAEREASGVARTFREVISIEHPLELAPGKKVEFSLSESDPVMEISGDPSYRTYYELFRFEGNSAQKYEIRIRTISSTIGWSKRIAVPLLRILNTSGHSLECKPVSFNGEPAYLHPYHIDAMWRGELPDTSFYYLFVGSDNHRPGDIVGSAGAYYRELELTVPYDILSSPTGRMIVELALGEWSDTRGPTLPSFEYAKIQEATVIDSSLARALLAAEPIEIEGATRREELSDRDRILVVQSSDSSRTSFRTYYKVFRFTGQRGITYTLKIKPVTVSTGDALQCFYPFVYVCDAHCRLRVDALDEQAVDVPRMMKDLESDWTWSFEAEGDHYVLVGADNRRVGMPFAYNYDPHEVVGSPTGEFLIHLTEE